MTKKIALIQGGLGSEKEVSLNTGASMARALDDLGYDYEIITADQNLPKTLVNKRPDIALIALHGKYAEDGIVQGICEYLKIPYTGSGVLSSSLLMDKIKSKEIMVTNKVPTPRYQVVDARSKPTEKDIKISLPIVIKPSRDGSSVGVSIVKEKEQIESALIAAAKWDYNILVEEFIDGAEVTVTVLDGKALPSIEIVPNEHFYDYEHKYTKGKTEYLIPAQLDEAVLKQLAEYSEFLFKCFGIRGYARVDFMVKNRKDVYVLEVNTLPGMTETSLVPKAAKAYGLEFKDLVAQIIAAAGLDYENLS